MNTWIAKLGLTALTAAALLLPSASTYAGSSKLYVDDDLQQCKTAQFTKVQDAINAAKPGDTVYVCSGSYFEQITITKKLTLRSQVSKGESLPLISNGVANSNTILVKDTKDVTIRDLRLAGTHEVKGIVIDHSPNVTVEHTDISTFKNGILAQNGSDKANLHNNTIFSSFDSIAVQASAQPKVTDNTISYPEFGITFIFVNGSGQVSGNTIDTPISGGIALQHTSKITVSKNSVKASKGFGIGSDLGFDDTFKDNTILNSGAIDISDDTLGNKTAGTANTWSNNTCKTSDPAGLCKK